MSLGVLVMRLQVDDLHEGHFDIIKDVIDKHTETLIVIGLSVTKCTLNNPLDYDTRRRMVLDHFPQVMVAYIEDCYDNDIWSKKLDVIIQSKLKRQHHTVDCQLYGSRDSFIPYYSGEYPTNELEQRVIISGSQIRKGLALQSRNTRDFRAGAIWFAMNQYPTAIPTVDMAVFDRENGRLLLGKKPGEDVYRFPGGFVQPGETYEIAAARELQEETGLRAKVVIPFRSFFIDDWRYKSETNKITTFLYLIEEFDGRVAPDDDIEECRWFDITTSEIMDHILPAHREMAKDLLKSLRHQRSYDILLQDREIFGEG